jgi:hypothetical protein
LSEGWHKNHTEKNEYTKTPMGVATEKDTHEAPKDGDEHTYSNERKRNQIKLSHEGTRAALTLLNKADQFLEYSLA